MRKIYLAGILGLFLVGLVSAITIGGIVTQAQLDGLDIENVDLGEAFVKEDGKAKFDCNRFGTCTFYITYMDLKYNKTSGDYTVVEKEYPIRTPIRKWTAIKAEHNKTYAIEQLRSYLVDKKNKQINNTKGKLMKQQSTEAMQDLVDDLNI